MKTSSRGNVIMSKQLCILAVGLFLVPAPALAQSEVVIYYHTDAIGSVRATSDENGDVIDRFDYLPFGELCEAACSASPTPDTRQFAGKERDAETGLDYFGARYFRAPSARFTSVDPSMDIRAALTNPQRWNRYAYAVNNPLKYVDPDGRDALWVNHPNGTATLVIPVRFVGNGATPSNVSAIVARVNGLTILDPNVSVLVVATNNPIGGKLNTMDYSSGYDDVLCKGAGGECTNKMGGNKAHINSDSAGAVGGAAHDILHFAGIEEGYTETAPAPGQRRGILTPKPGLSTSNIMTDRQGSELTKDQLQEAKKNKTTRKCNGKDAGCQ